MTKHFIYFIALFTISCFSGVKTSPDKIDGYCGNMGLLFSLGDSSDIFTINEVRDNKFAIKRDTNDSFSNKEYFGIKLNNNFIVKVFKPDLRKICTIYKYTARLMIKGSGQFAFNRQIIPLDSITAHLQRELKIDHNFKMEKISLILDQSTPKDSLDKAFMKIIEGFSSIYSSYSKRTFQKNICELNQNQINNLKKIIPFHIILEDVYTLSLSDIEN